MAPLARRFVTVVVGAAILAVASVVAPVPMAWSAPQVRYAEVAVRPLPPVATPFAAITLRLARAITAPFELSHLGVRWTGSDDAVVEVRTAAIAGAWGPWQPVEVSHDLGNEKTREVLSGLVRADGARLVQARARGDARDVKVVAIDAVHGRRRLVAAVPLHKAGAVVAQPGVITRAQWGADEGMRRPTPPLFGPVNRLVVHHTGTPDDDPDPASTMRAMYAYHVRGNGWDDLGYNVVVDSAGRVYEGRWARAYSPGEVPTGESVDGLGVQGAHAEGENAGSVGVAVMGTFTDRAPPQASVDAVQRVLAWKADLHGIDPLGTTRWASGRVLPTIVGHRDVGSTSCPGDRLWAGLPAIRQSVATLVARARAAVTPGYVVLGRDGKVFPFGGADAGLLGLIPGMIAPAAAIASTPTGRGYWAVSEGGRVVPSGDAPLLGSAGLVGLLGSLPKAVAIESTPTGQGYWVALESGQVLPFGDAPDLGSAPAGPVVGIARTPSGRGYWVTTADGRISTHGDARALGSVAGRAGPPIVAVAGAAGGSGYWQVAADGAVFPFGSARRAGGLPDRRIVATVVDARPSSSGRGYYLLGADGAVFAFGDAALHGAATGQLPAGAVGLASP